ncbi:glucose-6-phosphate isomerase family protein [Zongyangia hominis]|uniref:glucose-6-phosphate isomerase n=1 Tax=Zongyangia hominis TaxID=2763677 RepID=A0A926EA41_9FIRM|nr:glucose-6-phosphate isomerase family protein [Zongyangia hominis]MBC8570710.1 hypothetical protein [Zongyangia hominis]
MKALNYGLPVQMEEETGELKFGEGVLCAGVKAKCFGEIKNLAYDPEEAQDGEHCYTFYQDIWKEQDAPLFAKHRITNGITVLMPGLMGYECHKNSGHYHGMAEGRASTLPEVYEVLSGRAVFFLQQSHSFLEESGPLQVERLRAFFLTEGEKLVIPPFTAHCVVNVGKGPMAFGNLAVPCPLHYEPIARMHGFGMYLLRIQGQLAFVPNPRYRDLPLLEVARPKECPELGISFDTPLYAAFVRRPDTFAYLGHPGQCDQILAALYE